MKLRMILMVTILVASLSMSSCIVTSHETGVEISCDEFNENPYNVRNEFQVEIGDKITVKLCSNLTTGFQWKYETTGDIVLQVEDHDFEEPESNGDAGVAGKEVWTFEAVEKGITELRMEYSRPWEGGEKTEWTYTITVTVEEGPKN